MSARKPVLNGKHVSKPSGRRSAPDFQIPDPKLKKLLSEIYDQYQRLDDPAANKVCRLDFVFHMTDWMGDLQRLSEIYRHPELFDRNSAGDAVAGFLIHVTAHLMEAARLMMNYEPGYIFDSPKPRKKNTTTVKAAPRRRRPAPSP